MTLAIKLAIWLLAIANYLSQSASGYDNPYTLLLVFFSTLLLSYPYTHRWFVKYRVTQAFEKAPEVSKIKFYRYRACEVHVRYVSDAYDELMLDRLLDIEATQTHLFPEDNLEFWYHSEDKKC